MKKHYTTPNYIRWHKRRIIRLSKGYKKTKTNISSKIHDYITAPPILTAPQDLRLIENTVGYLAFLRRFRKGAEKHNGSTLILSNVNKIDYAAISILRATMDDFKLRNIKINGVSPTDPYVGKFLLESGFYNDMYDLEGGRRLGRSENSDDVIFERGKRLLTVKDQQNFNVILKKVSHYLIGENVKLLCIKSLIKELCANSMEWGATQNRQWMLGVKYEPDKVIFTVTDVGKGILDTLKIKAKTRLIEFVTLTSDSERLMGAFEKKYGSSSEEINRNKGLPGVKLNFDLKHIIKLTVISNNVILHFDDPQHSRTFPVGSARFKGTFYQWEMTKECILRIKEKENENI